MDYATPAALASFSTLPPLPSMALSFFFLLLLSTAQVASWCLISDAAPGNAAQKEQLHE